METRLGGRPWVAGYVPHELRMRFMRQHIGDAQADLVDPVLPEVYQNNWRRIAQSNSSIYDQLDGESSVYKCRTLSQYINGLRDHTYRSIRDPIVQTAVGDIRGFLVTWPLEFLSREDITPSKATQAVIPTDLWV